MEHLVKKSLDINPALRHGQDTGEVLAGLKQQAIARSDAQAPAAGGEGRRPRLSKEERRKQTISFFFEQKLEEFDDDSADILERERKLAEEKADLQAQYAEEIVDFLGMMAGGAETPEAREVLRTFRKFLTALGLTEAQVTERARNSR